MEIFAYEESNLYYTLGCPENPPINLHNSFAFELVVIQFICEIGHRLYDISGKLYKHECPQISTCFTMESQDFTNPEKTYQVIHDQLQNFQVPLIFKFKVIVDELIELAHKYSHCSVLFDDRYVLGLGVKINMSHIYKQINENDISNEMAQTKSCKICVEDIFGGSTILKMSCKHMFHLNCMKKLFDRNISCPSCTPINDGES